MNDTKRRSGIERATGRGYEEWYAVLDTWGAPGRPYREVADWLTTEHGLSAWWAQKLIVEYEQTRGLRPAGIRPDGTFAAGASKTVAVPVERLYAAFTDPQLRDRWLPGIELRPRAIRAGRSARFDWPDGATRISVTFAALDAGRSRVAVEHEQLPDAAAVDRTKRDWRDRLTALKSSLETTTTPKEKHRDHVDTP